MADAAEKTAAPKAAPATAKTQGGAGGKIADPPAAEKEKAPKASSAGFVELQQSLVGWGEKGDILEVDPSHPQIKEMLDQEHMVRVPKKDLVPDPGTLPGDTGNP
jgi:hypothetical protein